MSVDIGHLTCRELVEVLTDYLENALDPRERAEIERHLVFCRGCSNYVEQMRSTIDLLGRIEAGDGGRARSDKLLSIFRDWKAGRA